MTSGGVIGDALGTDEQTLRLTIERERMKRLSNFDQQGNISVKSVENKGSMFTVVLPINPVQAPAAP